LEPLYRRRQELAKIGDYPILEFNQADFFRQFPEEAADGLRGVPLGFDKGQDSNLSPGRCLSYIDTEGRRWQYSNR
jgi:hypothetical protein